MTTGVDETPQAPPTAAAPPATPPRRPGRRIVGALFAPNDAFDDISRRPDILIPLAILVFASLLSTIAVIPKLDFETEIREQVEANKNIADDDVERIVRFGVASAKVVGYASPVFSIAIFAIIAGILLLAFRMMGGEGTYKQAFSVTLYSWMPITLKALITTAVVLSRESVGTAEMAGLIKSNPGFLVDPKEQAVLYAILSSLDLFTIWCLVLLVIGFAYVSRFSKAQSAGIVITLWMVTVAAKIALAALSGSRMKLA